MPSLYAHLQRIKSPDGCITSSGLSLSRIISFFGSVIQLPYPKNRLRAQIVHIKPFLPAGHHLIWFNLSKEEQHSNC